MTVWEAQGLLSVILRAKPVCRGLRVIRCSSWPEGLAGLELGKKMAGAVGFEPTMRDPKSRALPLGYTPVEIKVG